jgi:hypothetical protein
MMLEDRAFSRWSLPSASHPAAVVGIFTIINPWRAFMTIARNIVAAIGGVRNVRGESTACRSEEERVA